MPRFQTYQVYLKGEPEPVEVRPNAFDWVDVRVTGDNLMAASWHAIHNALRREEAPVPRDFRGFLEVLDGMPDVLDEEEAGPLDPTGPTPSDA